MHKTGTTFLQISVFPKFRGINYVPPTTPFDGFLRLDMDTKYLVSNERLAGRLWGTPEQVNYSIQRLSELYPGSKVLMSFRKHDGFILSSYKQFLHQGGALNFSDYFDIESNSGFMKREQFIYRTRIESIVRHFGEMPFVFLLDEIKDNLEDLLHDMGGYLGAIPPSIDELDRRVLNKGVSYYQARILRLLNKWNRSEFNPTGRFQLDNRWTRLLKLDPRRLSQYWLSFLPDRPFITKEVKQEIRDYYNEDWEYVVSCENTRMLSTGSENIK
jgi:hypothetical protein